MRYNRACALARHKKYVEALTELEHAVVTWDADPAPDPDFDVRYAARGNEEGAELAVFRRGTKLNDALPVRSKSGKSFEQIVLETKTWERI